MVAAALIGSADLAFLVAYEIHVAMLYYFPGKYGRSYGQYIQPRGLIGGAIAAAGVVVLWRLLLWLATVLSSRRARIKPADQGSEDRSESQGPPRG